MNSLYQEKQMKEIRKIIGMGILVGKDHKYGVTDEQGNILVPCEMDAIDFMPDLNICIFEKDGLQGSYSSEAGYLPPLYEDLAVNSAPVSAWYQGKFGHFNEQLTFKEAVADEEAIVSFEKRASLKESILRDINANTGHLTESDHVKDEIYFMDDSNLIFFNKNGEYRIQFYGKCLDRSFAKLCS